jgi:hypothetical protein
MCRISILPEVAAFMNFSMKSSTVIHSGLNVGNVDRGVKCCRKTFPSNVAARVRVSSIAIFSPSFENIKYIQIRIPIFPTLSNKTDQFLNCWLLKHIGLPGWLGMRRCDSIGNKTRVNAASHSRAVSIVCKSW